MSVEKQAFGWRRCSHEWKKESDGLSGSLTRGQEVG